MIDPKLAVRPKELVAEVSEDRRLLLLQFRDGETTCTLGLEGPQALERLREMIDQLAVNIAGAAFMGAIPDPTSAEPTETMPTVIPVVSYSCSASETATFLDLEGIASLSRFAMTRDLALQLSQALAAQPDQIPTASRLDS